MKINALLLVIPALALNATINAMQLQPYSRPQNRTCLKQILELKKSQELVHNIATHYNIGAAEIAHKELMQSFENEPKYTANRFFYVPLFNEFTTQLRNNYASRLKDTNKHEHDTQIDSIADRYFPMIEMPAAPTVQPISVEKRSFSPVREESQSKRLRIDEDELSNNSIEESANVIEAPLTELQKLQHNQTIFAGIFESFLPKVDSFMKRVDTQLTAIDGRLQKLENRFKN